MFLFSPIYINQILGYEVSKTGLNAALAPIAQFAVKMTSGKYIAIITVYFALNVTKFLVFKKIFLQKYLLFLYITTKISSFKIKRKKKQKKKHDVHSSTLFHRNYDF